MKALPSGLMALGLTVLPAGVISGPGYNSASLTQPVGELVTGSAAAPRAY
jgi:hypothetical protein